MAPQTLTRIVTSTPTSPAFVAVRVVEDPVEPVDVRVRGPGGIVIEGLDIADVAALIRALS